jgi:hypothetical protein
MRLRRGRCAKLSEDLDCKAFAFMIDIYEYDFWKH